MTVSINGLTGITFPDGTEQATAAKSLNYATAVPTFTQTSDVTTTVGTAGATTFSVATDRTAFYTVGLRLVFQNTRVNGQIYTVSAATFTTETVVTITPAILAEDIFAVGAQVYVVTGGPIVQTSIQNISVSGGITPSLPNTGVLNLAVPTYPLVVTNGGTGTNNFTANGVLVGQGNNAISALSPSSTVGNVLTVLNASGGIGWAPPGSGGTGTQTVDIALRHQVFTSSGTFTVPSGVTTLYVTVTGGGGGGATKSGGGAGGTAIESISGLTPGNTISVTVGAGAGAGGTGGTSSFGVFLSATGGGGASGGNQVNGGAGGGGSGGDLNISGGSGGGFRDDSFVNYLGAPGGVSFWGSGGALSANGNGGGSLAYGGGGAGGSSGQGGAGGVVLVQWTAGLANVYPGTGSQFFTSNGTFTVPTAITSVKVTVVGGGANGAGTNGSGGGGGGVAILRINGLTSGGTVAVTVGSVSGTSSFGSYCSATGGSGVSGGAGSNGNINLPGGTGGTGGDNRGGGGGAAGGGHGGNYGYGGAGGVGGGGAFGSGGYGNDFGGGIRANATGYGSGGGGGGSGGTAGLVIVEW